MNERIAAIAKDCVGQKVAVMMARNVVNKYHDMFVLSRVRGILSRVCSDCIVLDNACFVVKVTNSMMSPQMEDPIGGSIVIHNSAIESLCQPRWCHAPLPGEDGYI